MIDQHRPERVKLFVLDTNVILHDATCIENFEEHDVAVPITVIEELDRFKRGHSDINFQARCFLRELDELTGDLLSEEGASLGEGHGTIRITLGTEVHEELSRTFLHDSPDHRILNSALMLQKREPDREVTLITKDSNLRLKARSLGMRAEDYTADKVESLQKLYTGRRIVDNVPGEAIDHLYQNSHGVSAAEFGMVEEPFANENFILRNGSKSALARYVADTDSFVRVEKLTAYGIQARNSEQTFALNALMDDNVKLVTLQGKAGTGKTLLALAAAIESRAKYRQILLARPIVPLGNRDIGYLPGDVSAKLDPYMQPLYDNLSVIQHQFAENEPTAQRLSEMRESGKIEIAPLAYIRGRSLQRMYFIVDEAQNLSPLEVKTIITRAGEGTKVVLTGDVEQIDHPYLDPLSNGMTYLINRMKNQPLFAHVSLEKGERSALAEVAAEVL